MNLWVHAALLVTGKAVTEIARNGIYIKQYPEDSELCFDMLNIQMSLLIFLTLLLIMLSGGPEHGPSVDCLSTSPKAALGNEHKQKMIAASIVYFYIHTY